MSIYYSCSADLLTDEKFQGHSREESRILLPGPLKSVSLPMNTY